MVAPPATQDSAMLRPLWLLALLCLLAACSDGRRPEVPQLALDGRTMGTSWSVRIAEPPEGLDALALQSALEERLVAVNALMSTYDPDSQLSRFNAAPPDVWFAVDAELLEVVRAARELSEATDGAFDVTVGPLVNAWGFGPERGTGEPTAAELAAARARVGFARLAARSAPPALRKTADTYVDLSAIAKGHGVDRLATVLDGQGCSDYLVDIGGEVRGRGRNPRGQLWRIGVEVPDPSRQGAVQRILEIDGMAVATSGDYRNYRESGGVRLSHTIDPRSGSPVAHGLASVTVLHASTMWADGYATALNVLGPEEAMALAERLELPVLLLVRAGTGFEERYNETMQRYLRSP